MVSEFQSNCNNVDILLKRVTIFLEGEEWDNAYVYCERVLDIDPENCKAYLYKLLAKLHISIEDDLALSDTPLEWMIAYKNALRFADKDTAERLLKYNYASLKNYEKHEEERLEREQIENERKIQEANRREEYSASSEARRLYLIALISSQKDKQKKIKEKIEIVHKDFPFQKKRSKKFRNNSIKAIITGILLFIGTASLLLNALLSELSGYSLELFKWMQLEFFHDYFFAIWGLLLILNTFYLFKIKRPYDDYVWIFSMFTAGLAGILCTISRRDYKESALSTYNESLKKLNAQLQQIEDEIYNAEQSLGEINQTYEAYKQ